MNLTYKPMEKIIGDFHLEKISNSHHKTYFHKRNVCLININSILHYFLEMFLTIFKK